MTIMQWMTHTIAQAGRAVQVADKALTHILVHDLFMQELQSAPSKRAAWIVFAHDHMVWKTGDFTAIGLYLRNGQLERKEGEYNVRLRQWGKHHTSVIAQGITRMTIEPHMQEYTVRGIQTTLSWSDGVPSVRYVRMRNGEEV